MTIRRRSLLTGLIAIPAATIPAAATGALVGGAPAQAAPAALSPSGFQLRRRAYADLSHNGANSGAYASTVAALEALLPHASAQAVLDDGNRAAIRITASEGAGLVSNFAAGFKFNSGDVSTAEWIPQGITTSDDALEAGTYEDRKAVLVSWYSDGVDGEKGVRISFVNRTDPLNPVYRHVLLVEPYMSGGRPTYRAVNIHAGGIAWYGRYLYVADTSWGLRVFDVNSMWTISGTAASIGRDSAGVYQAAGYKYVLPQVLAYDRAGSAAALRHSFVSLDRSTSPDSLLIGEYDAAGAGARLVRFNIDYTNRELLYDSGSSTVATADWAYRVDVVSMQGALSLNGKYYLSTSDGSGNEGDLGTWRPGSAVTMHYDTLPIGPEDLSYRTNTDELWTVTEYAGRRMAISVKAGSF
jgi:hypothetical protein